MRGTLITSHQSSDDVVNILGSEVHSQRHHRFDFVFGPSSPRPASAAAAPQLLHFRRHFQIEDGSSLRHFGEFVPDGPVGGRGQVGDETAKLLIELQTTESGYGRD